MNKRYDAVIFDLDGVLCSTDEYHYRAWKALADRLGIPFDREVNQRLRGVSRMESLRIVLERADRSYSEAELESLAAQKNEVYRGLLENLSPGDLLPGAGPALAALRERGYLLAVGSSSKNTKMILGKLGLADFFDAAADGTDITRSKPDPEVFLTAARRLGRDPSVCLVVEDASAGVEAARRGGFDAAGIDPAGRDPNALYHLESLSQLLEIL